MVDSMHWCNLNRHRSSTRTRRGAGEVQEEQEKGWESGGVKGWRCGCNQWRKRPTDLACSGLNVADRRWKFWSIWLEMESEGGFCAFSSQP